MTPASKALSVQQEEPLPPSLAAPTCDEYRVGENAISEPLPRIPQEAKVQALPLKNLYGTFNKAIIFSPQMSFPL